MRLWLYVLALVLAGCSSDPSHPFRCEPNALVLDPDSHFVACNPGTRMRLEAIGDGKRRRTLVVCDCVEGAEQQQDGGVDASPRRWR